MSNPTSEKNFTPNKSGISDVPQATKQTTAPTVLSVSFAVKVYISINTNNTQLKIAVKNGPKLA